MAELTGHSELAAAGPVILNAFRVAAGTRCYHAGFVLGDGDRFSGVGHAVIERLAMEGLPAPLHIVEVFDAEIAFDVVLRHLRTFMGQTLVFAFPDSDIYDAGLAETFYSKHVRRFDPDGAEMRRLTAAERRNIRSRKAAIEGRPPTPVFEAFPGTDREDAPWVFGLVTPSGKALRTAVWNGRRDYAHELPDDILASTGGDRIALVQVDSPVGRNRRSSLDLTHRLAEEFDGVIHWARDTETYQSILRSFLRLGLASVTPVSPPETWEPEVVIFAANTDPAQGTGREDR